MWVILKFFTPDTISSILSGISSREKVKTEQRSFEPGIFNYWKHFPFIIIVINLASIFITQIYIVFFYKSI